MALPASARWPLQKLTEETIVFGNARKGQEQGLRGGDPGAIFFPAVGDRARYDAVKRQVAAQVVDRLGTLYPGVSGQVEMIDVATPYTTWRDRRPFITERL